MQFKKEWLIPIGIGVSSFITGTGVGYAISKNYNRTKRSKIEERDFETSSRESDSSNEIDDSRLVELRFEYEEAKREFAFIIRQADHVIGKFTEAISIIVENQTTLLENSIASHPSNNGQLKLLNIIPDDNSSVSIFSDEDDDWNYDEEVLHRTPDKPYIIHREEYEANEMDFDQSSLMYYEADNVLCDDKDVPIYDILNVIGEPKFGHGSQDPSICYIRNERLKSEFEVIVDHGYYQVEVLGQRIEDAAKAQDLKHSHRIPKFRME